MSKELTETVYRSDELASTIHEQVNRNNVGLIENDIDQDSWAEEARFSIEYKGIMYSVQVEPS